MTDTYSSVVSSEIRAVGANIKQQNAVNDVLIKEQLKRIRFDCRKYDGIEIDEHEAARLVLGDMQEHDVDEALINEFKRLYVGG